MVIEIQDPYQDFRYVVYAGPEDVFYSDTLQGAWLAWVYAGREFVGHNISLFDRADKRWLKH